MSASTGDALDQDIEAEALGHSDKPLLIVTTGVLPVAQLALKVAAEGKVFGIAVLDIIIGVVLKSLLNVHIRVLEDRLEGLHV